MVFCVILHDSTESSFMNLICPRFYRRNITTLNWRFVGESEKAYKILVYGLILFFRHFVFRDHRRRGGQPYPPGPPPRPIIENILDIPKDAPWIAYVDMSRKHGTHIIIGDTCSPLPKLTPAFQGDVICLCVFSEVVVVLNSLSALKDLPGKRGQSYSERPPLPIAETYLL
jgi:hypothetical protein